MMDAQIEAILHGGQVKKVLEAHSQELRSQYDLKKAELEILYFLSKCEGRNTSTDIRHQLMMNKGHISQAVDSLCKKGYLCASTDPDDRRYVHLEILEAAREVIAEITRRREALYRQIFEGVTEEEMQMLKGVAVKLRTNLDHLD